MPETYPMPVKQIITEANKVETYDEQYVCLWKEAIQAIAKAERNHAIQN